MINSSDFVIENGVLKKYVGPGGDVVVPEGVTTIGDGAFKNSVNLTSITLPEGVTIIGDSAFHGCARLTSVTLPEGLTCIGKRPGVGKPGRIHRLIFLVRHAKTCGRGRRPCFLCDF